MRRPRVCLQRRLIWTMAWIQTSHVKGHVKPPLPTTATTHKNLQFLPFVMCDHKICAVEILAKLKMGAERQEAAGSKLAPGLQRR